MDIGKSVCHSLNEIGGEVIGDEMEVAIFHKMEAKISQNNIRLKNGELVKKIKTFDFRNDLQRMSVIINLENKYLLFTKGSPEKMKQLCVEIDNEFEANLYNNVKYGYRVLSIGYKEI